MNENLRTVILCGQTEAVFYSQLYKSFVKDDPKLIKGVDIMCIITGLSILGILGWGAYAAVRAALANRSTIVRYAYNFYNLPETTYQAAKVKEK